MNIGGYIKMINEKNIHFSESAQKEIKDMQTACAKLFDLLEETPEDIIAWHEEVTLMEQQIDDLTVSYRNNLFARIQKGVCSDEGSILFSEMLVIAGAK